MGRFNTIWEAFKDVIEADADTKDLRIYAGEETAKPKLPCLVGFPRRKRWERPDTDRRRRLPRKVWYEFDIVILVSAKDREGVLFGDGSIEDWAEKVEDVMEQNGTLGGAVYGLNWSEVNFEFRPGFMAMAAISLATRLKETE
jgi:hypothetical protein